MDAFIEPIYGLEGGPLYFPTTNVSFFVDKIAKVNGSYVEVMGNITVVLREGVEGVNVVEVNASQIPIKGGHRIVRVEAVVEVPEHSIAYRVLYWVAGGIVFNVSQAPSGDYLVEVKLTGLKLALENVNRLPETREPILPMWVGELVIPILVDGETGSAYLLENGEKTYIGSRFPVFIYPEAFDTKAIAMEYYEGLKSWIKETLEDPTALEVLVEKLRRVKGDMERLKIIEEFYNNVVFSSISPSYIYLGTICSLDISGGVSEVCRGVEVPTSNLSLLSLNSTRLAELLARVNLDDVESLRESISKAFYFTNSTVRDAYGNERYIMTVMPHLRGLEGLLSNTSEFILTLPLPRDNPLGAKLVTLYWLPFKAYPCDLWERVKRDVEEKGLTRDDVRLEVEGNDTIKVYDRRSGSLLFASTSASDINGTDYIGVVADENVRRLNSHAVMDWKVNGDLLSRLIGVDIHSFVVEEIINPAVASGVESLDYDAIMKKLEEDIGSKIDSWGGADRGATGTPSDAGGEDAWRKYLAGLAVMAAVSLAGIWVAYRYRRH